MSMTPAEFALKLRRLDLLRGTCEVAENVAEVDGRLIWGRPRPTSGGRSGCPGGCARSWASTWPVGP
jgi:hypothetical protein